MSKILTGGHSPLGPSTSSWPTVKLTLLRKVVLNSVIGEQRWENKKRGPRGWSYSHRLFTVHFVGNHIVRLWKNCQKRKKDERWNLEKSSHARAGEDLTNLLQVCQLLVLRHLIIVIIVIFINTAQLEEVNFAPKTRMLSRFFDFFSDNFPNEYDLKII